MSRPNWVQCSLLLQYEVRVTSITTNLLCITMFFLLMWHLPPWIDNKYNENDVDRTSSMLKSVLCLWWIRGRVFSLEYCSLPVLYYHQMNVETRVKKVLFLLINLMFTVTTVWNTGETGDINVSKSDKNNQTSNIELKNCKPIKKIIGKRI